MNECRWSSDFTLECIIRPRRRTLLDDLTRDADTSQSDDDDHDALKFPVFVRRKATGELLQVVNIPCQAVCGAYPAHFKPCPADPSSFCCVLHGAAHVVCAVNQKVWLKEARLLGEQHEDGIVLGEITDS